MQYVNIKDVIVEQIETGMLLPRQKLPAERTLAESFNTTRVTLREALSLLEAQGRIYREDRRGWFISPEPLRYDLTKNLNFNKMALNQQRVPQTHLIDAKSNFAPKKVAALLALPPFTNVYHVDRVRYLEDRPVAFVSHFIRPELFPNLLELDLTQSLTDIYQQHYGERNHKTRYRICSSTLLGYKAQALRATTGSPAMVVEKVSYNQDGQLMVCDIEYWRHDAISIESTAELVS